MHNNVRNIFLVAIFDLLRTRYFYGIIKFVRKLIKRHFYQLTPRIVQSIFKTAFVITVIRFGAHDNASIYARI